MANKYLNTYILEQNTSDYIKLNIEEITAKIGKFLELSQDTSFFGGKSYLKKVKEGKEVKEYKESIDLLNKIRNNVQYIPREKFNEYKKIILKDYVAFVDKYFPEDVVKSYLNPLFENIVKEFDKLKESFSLLTVSLSAATNINEALDNVQGVVEFYGDPNNMEALQKLQKNDNQAVLQIYNIGKDFLKYSKDIDKNNLKRAQEAYSAYLKLLDDIPGSYSRYFEPLAEQLGKALVEKEDELSPQQGTKPPSQPSAAGGTSQSIPSAAKPPTSIPSGPVKPIGVTGMGTPNAGKKPAPKKDYKTLLATDDRGGSLYFVRIGPGNYRPAVQADKDAGVQLFARNPNPAARMVYPFIKIQNMPTRRASPI